MGVITEFGEMFPVLKGVRKSKIIHWHVFTFFLDWIV